MRCEACGREIAPDSVFCGYCGVRVGAGVAPTVPFEPVAAPVEAAPAEKCREVEAAAAEAAPPTAKAAAPAHVRPAGAPVPPAALVAAQTPTGEAQDGTRDGDVAYELPAQVEPAQEAPAKPTLVQNMRALVATQRRNYEEARAAREAAEARKLERILHEQELLAAERARWDEVAPGFALSRTDNQVRINSQVCERRDLLEARIRENVTSYTRTKGHSKSKRKLSVGKAVVGGVLFGAPGAVAGALLGKSEGDSHYEAVEELVCDFVAVDVITRGFVSTVVLLNGKVPMASERYTQAHIQALEVERRVNLIKAQFPRA